MIFEEILGNVKELENKEKFHIEKVIVKRDDLLKRIMRVIDHCNVFILEAGTFTPVCLIALSDKIGIVYFYIIWLITIIGIIINIIDVDKYENISLILHLIMGWSVLFVFNKLLRTLNIEELRYLFGGGLFYTVGSFLYYIEKATDHTRI